MSLLIRLLDISGHFHPIWRSKEAKGAPVGEAAAETVRTLREHAARGGADHVVACCDSGRSFRHAIGEEWRAVDPTFRGYKGNRPAKDPAMMAALDRVIDELDQDGVPILRAPGFEADDIIATVTKWAVEQGHDVEIFTEDKDLMVLVRDPGAERDGPFCGSRVRVVRRDGSALGPDEVEAKFGVPPARLSEYLAIVGDVSDHVPGVKGMGDKAAQGLINKHGGYLAALDKAKAEEAAVADPDSPIEPEFTAKQRAALVAGEAAFRISLRMTTLRGDVSLDFEAVTAERRPKPRPNKTPWHEPAPVAAEETIIEIGEDEDPMTTEKPAADLLPPLPPPAPDVTGEPVAAPQTNAQIVAPNRQIVRLSPEQFKLALEPQTYEMARTVAEDMFDSGLFAVQRVQAALALIQVGRAHGLSAVTSLMEIHMIEGKPQMSAKLMVALVRKSGKADYFKLIEASPRGAKWKTHRKDDPDPDPVFGSFTIEEAKTALLGGIATKTRDGISIGEDFKPESQYAKYPEDMCVWRAAVRLIRREYSDVVGGLYATEEMDEYAPTTPHLVAA